MKKKLLMVITIFMMLFGIIHTYFTFIPFVIEGEKYVKNGPTVVIYTVNMSPVIPLSILILSTAVLIILYAHKNSEKKSDK